MCIYTPTHIHTQWNTRVFPGGSDGEESSCNAKDLSLVAGSGRSPGGGNGNPLQYSCILGMWSMRETEQWKIAFRFLVWVMGENDDAFHRKGLE